MMDQPPATQEAPAKDVLNRLIDQLIERRRTTLAKKISIYPRNNFIASDIGECDRQMVYGVLNWKDRAPFNEYVQAMLEVGKEHEAKVHRDLLEDGFQVVEGQMPFEIKHKRTGRMICRGKIDGKVLFENVRIPFEIKTMNINTFNSIRYVDDFNKKPHLRKYLRQMQMYLYGHNFEFGFFILTDLQGHYKYIPVYLDYGEVELILTRMESSQDAIDAIKAEPDPVKAEALYPRRIEYSEKLCGKCAFKHICLQGMRNEGANFVDLPELEAKLERQRELKPLVDEYEDIVDTVKEDFREVPDTFVGTKWRIMSKKSVTKRLDQKAIPEDIKAQYMKDSEMVKVSIVYLEKEAGQ